MKITRGFLVPVGPNPELRMRDIEVSYFIHLTDTKKGRIVTNDEKRMRIDATSPRICECEAESETETDFDLDYCDDYSFCRFASLMTVQQMKMM